MRYCLPVAVAMCAAASFGAIDLNGSWEFRFEEGRYIADTADPSFAATDRMSVPGCYDMMPRAPPSSRR